MSKNGEHTLSSAKKMVDIGKAQSYSKKDLERIQSALAGVVLLV